MTCPRCGTINDGNDQFCGNCGAVMASSRPPVNKAPVSPVSPYDSSMDAPTIAQTFPPAQPTQYVSPPTQYVPPEYGPGGAWAAPQGGYAVPTQSAPWADYPIAQPAPPSAYSLPASRKRRRWPWYLLLFLVIFGVILSTSWVFLLRPAVHQSVDGEIRQGLQQAIDQVPPAPPGTPANVPFDVQESDINGYIAQNIGALAPITDMHVSLQPGVMVVTFQAYGFGSTIHLGLAVKSGTLVATNVDVSGLLWWVETSSDLTTRFDEALGQVPGKLGRQLATVAIGTGVIQFTLA
jgi:zinc-ribbon domain